MPKSQQTPSRKKVPRLKITDLNISPILKNLILTFYAPDAPIHSLIGVYKNGKSFVMDLIKNKASNVEVGDLLNALTDHAKTHSTDVAKFLNQSDDNEFTICHAIAQFQDETCNKKLIHLLLQMAQVNKGNVLNVLSPKDKLNLCLGHYLAVNQSESCNAQFLDLLSLLAEKFPLRVTDILESGIDNGHSQMHKLVARKLPKINVQLLELLTVIGKKDPARTLTILSKQKSSGATIGHSILTTNDQKSAKTYLMLVAELAITHPMDVLKLLRLRNQNYFIAHLLARNDKEYSSKLIDLLNCLASSHPNEVQNLLFLRHAKCYGNSSVGYMLIQSWYRNNANSERVNQILPLLLKLIRANPTAIVEDITLGISKPDLNDYSDSDDSDDYPSIGLNDDYIRDADQFRDEERASIVRLVFSDINYTKNNIHSVLDFLIIAAQTNLTKTQFLCGIYYVRTQLSQVVNNIDGLAVCKSARLLDLLGNKNAPNYINRWGVELAVNYITTLPHTPEQMEWANEALKPGTNLNRLISRTFSSQESDSCCFPFFKIIKKPQEFLIRIQNSQRLMSETDSSYGVNVLSS